MSGFEGVQEDEAWSVVETKKPSQKKTEVKPRPGQGKRKYDRSKDSVQEKGPARGSKASDSKPKSTTSKTGSETQSTNETKKTTNKVIEVIKNIESVEQVAKDLKAMSLEEVSTTTDPVPVEESLPSVPSPAPVVKNVYKNMAEALKNGLSGMDEIPADNVLSESMHTLPSSSSSGTMVVGNKISVLEFSILSQQFNFSSRNVMEDNKVYKITR